MLILESFQAGLSWECVLNKRESFRAAYDNFDVEKVSAYGEDKISELLGNIAFLYAIPFLVVIAVCIVFAIVFYRKSREK